LLNIHHSEVVATAHACRRLLKGAVFAWDAVGD
jgi:hypothetical protein